MASFHNSCWVDAEIKGVIVSCKYALAGCSLIFTNSEPIGILSA